VQWEFIWDLAKKIDRDALREARNRADALAGQKAVYAALGMGGDYEAEVASRRKEARAERSSRSET
jgi:xylose isomerase